MRILAAFDIQNHLWALQVLPLIETVPASKRYLPGQSGFGALVLLANRQ